MATYIKKIATTPVRGNGFIIDSFNTTDNKSLNAPSLAAVEKRADNNLLYGGNLTSSFIKKVGNVSNAQGWNVTKTSNTGAFYFAETIGYNFLPGFVGYLSSPNFLAKNGIAGTSEIGEELKFSLTVIYAVGSATSGAQFKTATLENLSLDPSAWPTEPFIDESGVTVSLNSLHHNVYLKISVAGSSNINIKYIKLERGTTATPVTWVSKDPGIMQASLNAARTAILSAENAYIFTVEGTFTTDSNGHASIEIPDMPFECSQDNTTVLSIGVIDGYDNLIFAENNNEYSVSRASVLIDSEDKFYLRYLGVNTADISATLSYRITFLKFK